MVLHGADMRVKTALMTGGLVFMDPAFASHAVDGRYGSLVGSLRRFFFAGFNGV